LLICERRSALDFRAQHWYTRLNRANVKSLILLALLAQRGNPSLSAIAFGQRRSPSKTGFSRTSGFLRWITTVDHSNLPLPRQTKLSTGKLPEHNEKGAELAGTPKLVGAFARRLIRKLDKPYQLAAEQDMRVVSGYGMRSATAIHARGIVCWPKGLVGDVGIRLAVEHRRFRPRVLSVQRRSTELRGRTCSFEIQCVF
jgi:hypothetical protein